MAEKRFETSFFLEFKLVTSFLHCLQRQCMVRTYLKSQMLFENALSHLGHLNKPSGLCLRFLSATEDNTLTNKNILEIENSDYFMGKVQVIGVRRLWMTKGQKQGLVHWKKKFGCSLYDHILLFLCPHNFMSTHKAPMAAKKWGKLPCSQGHFPIGECWWKCWLGILAAGKIIATLI